MIDITTAQREAEELAAQLDAKLTQVHHGYDKRGVPYVMVFVDGIQETMAFVWPERPTRINAKHTPYYVEYEDHRGNYDEESYPSFDTLIEGLIENGAQPRNKEQ